VGSSTKNQGEFYTLFSLLKCVVGHNIHPFQVLGDYKFFIDWMVDFKTIYNPKFLNLGKKITVLSAIFHFVRF